ncbi:MAG TPA: hypothetical protein VGR48_05120 [Terriglobales bacterium]|nr:hypothetical protein [Terriglobales bacterium]
MEFQTQLIWRRWRLEQDTRTIAADLDVPYWCVQESLKKLRRCAVGSELVPGESKRPDRRAENNRRMTADPAFIEKRRQGIRAAWANPEKRAPMVAAQRLRRAREAADKNAEGKPPA